MEARVCCRIRRSDKKQKMGYLQRKPLDAVRGQEKEKQIPIPERGIESVSAVSVHAELGAALLRIPLV